METSHQQHDHVSFICPPPARASLDRQHYLLIMMSTHHVASGVERKLPCAVRQGLKYSTIFTATLSSHGQALGILPDVKSF